MLASTTAESNVPGMSWYTISDIVQPGPESPVSPMSPVGVYVSPGSASAPGRPRVPRTPRPPGRLITSCSSSFWLILNANPTCVSGEISKQSSEMSPSHVLRLRWLPGNAQVMSSDCDLRMMSPSMTPSGLSGVDKTSCGRMRIPKPPPGTGRRSINALDDAASSPGSVDEAKAYELAWPVLIHPLNLAQ